MPEAEFRYSPDPDGLNFVYGGDPHALNHEDSHQLARLQRVTLGMLVEQGLAERIANGFSVPSNTVCRLDRQECRILRLPERFPGSYRLSTEGRTVSADFTVGVVVLDAQGRALPNLTRLGPLLFYSESEVWLLNAAELLAFEAIEKHEKIQKGTRREQDNLRVIAALQRAASGENGIAMQIDLAHFGSLRIRTPERVGVSASETESGDLLLTPNFGTGANPEDIASRLGQIAGNKDTESLRVQSDIILLDEERLEATREILSNRRIPLEQVSQFLETPSAFLNAALVDLDTGFSLRVKGVGRFELVQFGETDGSGIEWFRDHGDALPPAALRRILRTPQDLESFRARFQVAVAQGADVLALDHGQAKIDVSERVRVQHELDHIQETFQQATVGEKEGHASGEHPGSDGDGEAVTTSLLLEEVEDNGDQLRRQLDELPAGPEVDYSAYPRAPYPHQREGIDWFLRLARPSVLARGSGVLNAGIQGALLADDMGLGKTYMSLVGIGELARALKLSGALFRPVLVVAPLSLLENWAAECEKTYAASPFDDVVILQAQRDLPKFRLKGAQRETKQVLTEETMLDVSALRYSLKIGREYGPERLDMPQRLVLATYQTLRDYQYSLCRIDWSLVVFDEAQNIKSPNTLQTRAAKGLKSAFKLLATGTPVENDLLDFWCLMDTAQPGLLGDWPEFRQAYVQPINAAADENKDSVRLQVGQKIRADVGDFMLRRLKEDRLDGLPLKRVYTGRPEPEAQGAEFRKDLAAMMVGRQLEIYDQVIEEYVGLPERGQGAALAAISKLRSVSLHPELLDEEADFLTASSKEAQQKIILSAKLDRLVSVLLEIELRQEKVIIFLINKVLQRSLSLWLEQLFGVAVPIINGDTAAVARSQGKDTRQSLIASFEARRGFAMLIMSPIAAGVGLTVVGANNVIHLERHWNPAKEAQATDRVYRIGQRRDVNIYYPLSHHPSVASFDLNLDRLLARKTGLKDAVVTPGVITETEMESVLSGA